MTGFEDFRLRHHRDLDSGFHEVIGVNGEGSRQLVHAGEVGWGHGEWCADEPAERLPAVADRDDEVSDLPAIEAQLGLVEAILPRRRIRQLASPEVLQE